MFKGKLPLTPYRKSLERAINFIQIGKKFKKAISFSLYGDNDIYTIGMIKNAILAQHIFTDWDVVVFHDNTVPERILEELRHLYCYLIDCTGYRESGMFWRFLINDMAERWICRDVDCRLSARDLYAVHDWIASGAQWHIIKDTMDSHENHFCLGGLWGGFHTGIDMRHRIDLWHEFGKYGDDLRFIQIYLGEEILKNVYIHDIVDNPIKLPRPAYRYYLGQVWTANEQRL